MYIDFFSLSDNKHTVNLHTEIIYSLAAHIFQSPSPTVPRGLPQGLSVPSTASLSNPVSLPVVY